MALFESYLLGLAASATWGLTEKTAAAIVNHIRTKHPKLLASLEAAETTGDEENLRNELAGLLEVAAADGIIEINDALISAVRSATFDHQHGKICISDTEISAPTLITGGQDGATGSTEIGGDTTLSSAGTKIVMRGNAGIRISGNASIKQN